MSLDNESRQAMIAYRLEKADVSLEDAAFLTDAGRYGLAANRLYYALYYAASALLLSKGIITKRHSGLITQMHFHFIKTGILSPEEGGLFKVMFDLRHEGDYEDFIEVEHADIEEDATVQAGEAATLPFDITDGMGRIHNHLHTPIEER